jgi:apolipoprotein N-acyltransferase
VQPRDGGWRRFGLPAVAVALALLLAQQARSLAFTEPSGTLSVSLLQGNVPQEEKFSRVHLPQALTWAHTQLLAASGDLVVAPETVIPMLPAELDPHYWESLLRHFQQGRQAALIGIPLGDQATGYTNSAIGISAATVDRPGGYYRYDKHHLVPFGEFIPTGFKWFTRMMNIPLGDFNRGPLAAPSFDVRGERVAPNICYEDLFGEELATRFRDAAAAPTIFANLSNIGWFGKTIAVEQHLEISRMRSLEFERAMIRATNTGATAIIDHRSVVTRALPPFTQGVLEGTVQGRTGLTPYAWWAARWGLWPLWALGLALLLGSALGRAPRRRP